MVYVPRRGSRMGQVATCQHVAPSGSKCQTEQTYWLLLPPNMPLKWTDRVKKRMNSELYWEQGWECEWVRDFLRTAWKAVSALPAIADEGRGCSNESHVCEGHVCEVKAWGDLEWAVGQRSEWFKEVYLLSTQMSSQSGPSFGETRLYPRNGNPCQLPTLETSSSVIDCE